MKRLTKLLFLCTVLVLGCTGKVWAVASHDAKLQAQVSEASTGGGRVYVSTGDEGPVTPNYGEENGAVKTVDAGSGVTYDKFYAYAEPARGSKFSNWSISGDGDPAIVEEIGGNDNIVRVQVTASSTDNGTNTATIEATFVPNDVARYDVQYVSAVHGTYTAEGPEGYGAITIDGDAISTWNTDKITLTATPDAGWQFYRWIIKDENGIKETLGEALTNPLTTTLPTHARTVSAEFITDANFIVGESTFEDFADALQFASTAAAGGEDVTILQMKDYTIADGYYTIPKGVTLLIPRNAAQIKPVGTSVERENYNDNLVPSLYRKLTLENEVHINVNGAVEIGGLQNSYNNEGVGVPIRTFGQLHMNEGSTITLNSSASFRAWGYVTGKGTIDARRGAKCYEMFQIYDFKGGNATAFTFNNNRQKVFPLNQYFIQNIEVATTYHPGARLYTCMAAVGTDVDNVGIIGTHGETAMFLMDEKDDSEDTWVRKSYDAQNDKQVYEINSAAQLSSMVLDLGGYSFNSSAYVLPVTNNMVVSLLYGSMTIIQDVSFLPGSQLNVAKEATADIKSGKKLFFYDSDDWDTYAYNGTFAKTVKFSPSWSKCPRNVSTKEAIGDAILNVHGTFKAYGSVYTTEHGASILSTNEDAGTFEFCTSAPEQNATVYQAKFKTFEDRTAVPALLKNKDGVADTRGTNAGKSYCYMNDRWTLMDVDPDNDCFMLDNYGIYYAKPGEYVAIDATKDPETKAITGNADHTFSDYAGEGRLFILMDDCQWWEVEFENNRYHKKVEAGSDEAPKYYEYDEEKKKWVDYRYTITWKNGDDVIATYKLTAGTEPKYLGTNPTRPEDIDYTYNFVGWTPALTTVTGDATYTATYDAVEKRYLIRFINENGGEIERQFLKRGEMPVCSSVPNKADHYLVWSPTIAEVTGAQDYTATYLENEPTEFTVTWKNFDGTEIYHETVAKNATPAYNTATYGTPTKTVSGSEYDYTFTGWSPAIGAVTADVAYTAQFSQAKKTFAIRFLDENGTQIGETQNVEAGAMPIIPACSKIDHEEGHVYTLVWSPLVEAVSKAQDYTATFTDEINKYTVTLIGNGCSVTGSGTYNHGTNVTITATANPGREFVKWSDENTDNPRTLTITGPVNLWAVTNSIPMIVSDTEDKTIKSPIIVEEVVISASEKTSGQLFGIENLTIIGNVYFDYTFNGAAYNRAKQNWYAFAVPFEVDATALQYKTSEGNYASCVLGSMIDIVYYNGRIRAEQGPSANAWEYVEDHGKTLYPGKLYLAAFSNDKYAGMIRFPKKAGAALIASNTVALSEYSSANETDANWNGIANPALYYAKMNAENVIIAQEYIYREGESSYKTVVLSDKTFSVGRPVFIQSAATSANAVKAARPAASAPARVRAAQQSELVDVRIAADGAVDYSDRLFVAVDEEKQNEYTIGVDLVKAGVATKRAQMWVDNYDNKLCFNTIAPLNDRAEWQLGVYVPTSGTYTINQASANEGTLYLTRNGQVIWNLSMGEYVGNFNAGTDNTYGLRLVIQAPNGATDLEEAAVSNNGVGTQKIIVKDHLLIIRDGQVYDVQGNLLK